jgi:aminoglycoside phosphotransferase (APT) family kinase protein
VLTVMRDLNRNQVSSVPWLLFAAASNVGSASMSPFDPVARQWVERELGERANIVSLKRLPGGVSSLIHEVTFTRAATTDQHQAILRRVEFREDHPTEAASEIANETRVLSLLNGQANSPVLIATDTDGSQCGLPATLQTRLPGRPVVSPKQTQWWVDGLAQATLAVREATIGAEDADGLGHFRPWWPDSAEPPKWTSSAHTWSRVAERLRVRLPTGHDVGLVHRDLHPGNVLFHRRRWSGIVDWPHGCIGPAEVDVSRCRVQIAFLTSMAAADRYLAACRDVVPTYDHDWDALVAIELSPWVEDIAEAYQEVGSPITEHVIQQTLDHFVQAAEHSDGHAQTVTLRSTVTA